MQSLIYKNINSHFTYENIYLHLNNFWLSKVITSNYSKIWLSIHIMYTNNNNSLTLIKNLPFNINDYKDLLLVIKENYKDTISTHNSEYNLKSIQFTYRFENKVDNRIFLLKLVLYISLLTILLILLIDLYNYYYMANIIYDNNYINGYLKRIPEELYENCSNKTSINPTNKTDTIFKSFIDLFDKSQSKYKYFPSCFIHNGLNYKTVVNSNGFDLLAYYQYSILWQNTDKFIELLKDLSLIIQESKHLIR